MNMEPVQCVDVGLNNLPNVAVILVDVNEEGIYMR
jgi:hypothetical protein